MKWLESGTRRDMCALLYAHGELRGPRLKTQLDDHYGTHVDSRRFYDRLNALVESGHVDSRVEGLDDVYFLTGAGERAFREHYAWLTECVDAGNDRAADGPDGNDGDH